MKRKRDISKIMKTETLQAEGGLAAVLRSIGKKYNHNWF